MESRVTSSVTIRLTCITAALDAGFPLRDVQEAASHNDPRTTMRYDPARVSLDRMSPISLPRTSPRRSVNRTKAGWSATAACSPHRPEFLRPAQASYEVRLTVGPETTPRGWEGGAAGHRGCTLLLPACRYRQE